MRGVNLVAPNRLRITTDRVTYEYTLEVWCAGDHVHRLINLYRTDGQAAYTVTIGAFNVHPRNATWRCNCPAAKYKGGQCKHVLALKAGLRSVGCKV